MDRVGAPQREPVLDEVHAHDGQVARRHLRLLDQPYVDYYHLWGISWSGTEGTILLNDEGWELVVEKLPVNSSS